MDFIIMAFLVIGVSALIRYIYLETKIASHIADSQINFSSLDKKINFFVDQLNIMKSDLCRQIKEQNNQPAVCCDPCKKEEAKSE